MTSLKDRLQIDCTRVENDIIHFIRNTVAESEAKGVVLGLSGGIDSSVVVTICARALEGSKVLGLLMPSEFTPDEDTSDARELAENLGIQTHLIPMSQIVDKLLETIPLKTKSELTVGNIFARMRMIMNYSFANSMNFLVAGTGDRSELMIGYFTKYGDGGADFMPIAHLYKTQVKQLAKHLGLPSELVDKPSSPQLWKGQKATDEIPIDYPTLDQVLCGLFDANMNVKDIAEQLNIESEIIVTVQKRFEDSRHKRTTPRMLTPPKLD